MLYLLPSGRISSWQLARPIHFRPRWQDPIASSACQLQHRLQTPPTEFPQGLTSSRCAKLKQLTETQSITEGEGEGEQEGKEKGKGKGKGNRKRNRKGDRNRNRNSNSSSNRTLSVLTSKTKETHVPALLSVVLFSTEYPAHLLFQWLRSLRERPSDSASLKEAEDHPSIRRSLPPRPPAPKASGLSPHNPHPASVTTSYHGPPSIPIHYPSHRHSTELFHYHSKTRKAVHTGRPLLCSLVAIKTQGLG